MIDHNVSAIPSLQSYQALMYIFMKKDKENWNICDFKWETILWITLTGMSNVIDETRGGDINHDNKW